MPALTSLTFDDWIEHAFGHEIRVTGNQWFFDDDPPWWAPDPQEAVAYLTRLFENPVPPLEWFSDAQIAQGFTYLVNTSASGDNGWLHDRSVAAVDRRRCIHAIFNLFAQIFAPRCAPVLGHLDREGGRALNTACYMWWDVFPCVALPDDPAHGELNLATLDVMRRTLELDSIACQESALHGLGHAHWSHPRETEAIIDGFLSSNPVVDPAIASYARSARCGCVL